MQARFYDCPNLVLWGSSNRIPQDPPMPSSFQELVEKSLLAIMIRSGWKHPQHSYAIALTTAGQTAVLVAVVTVITADHIPANADIIVYTQLSIIRGGTSYLRHFSTEH